MTGLHDDVAAALSDRPVRAYPALVSTEAAAQAWARSGAEAGSVVVAGYQASPRGRAGWPWTVDAGRDVTLSVVLRPDLPAAREGWLYTVGSLAVSDVCGDARFSWPDQVGGGDGDLAGAVGVHAELGPDRVVWAVVSVLLVAPEGDRGAAAVAVLDAIDRRVAAEVDHNLSDARARCRTLGRQVTARLVPLGPAGPAVTGRADDLLADGALVVVTERGSRVAVRPQNLGVLEGG